MHLNSEPSFKGEEMFAIFESGGKQYKAKVDDIVVVEKLDSAESDTYVFDKVLGVYDADLISGDPYVKGAKVEAQVVKQGKAKKILVFHFKRRKKFRKLQGHRQPFTRLKITSISLK
jgi:large subunit ribosomal protein L21